MPHYCLSIESTAHTFGAAILLDDGAAVEVYSNVRDIFRTKKGGLIPAQVAEHHVAHAIPLVQEALRLAGVTMSDVSFIAYSASPGMGHSLRIGAACARTLALQFQKPLVAVHHGVAHLEIGRYEAQFSDPLFFYLSGVSTQLIAQKEQTYKIYGESLDIGVGNFLDSIARLMGLGFPGGPVIEQLASRWDGALVELPMSVKGMDVSFTGLQSRVKQLLAQGVSVEAIAYAVQEHVFAMLVEVAERGLAHTGKNSFLLVGGVACNTRLQRMCADMCAARNVEFAVLPKEYLVDNAAMIGLVGCYLFADGVTSLPEKSGISPHLRLDDVEFVVPRKVRAKKN